MAKKPVKSVAKKVAKPANLPAGKAGKSATSSKSKKPAVNPVEKASEDVLKKLKSLNIESGLQADIQWCLGSYRNDKNPSGLYVMIEKALPVLKSAAVKNAKALPAKFISDLEKTIKSR